MKTFRPPPGFFTALFLVSAAVLGCRNTAKTPDWTKAKKIAGKEQKLSHISGMVVDDKFAYITVGGTVADQNEGTSGLRKVALDSGAVTNLEDGKAFPQSERGGIAIDERFIYWNGGGKILRLSKEGGKPEAIASEHVGIGLDMAIDNEKIYWANHGYYSPNSSTKPSPIYVVSKPGGQAEIFADQQNIPHSLVVDEEFVYWVTPDSIVKQAKSGGQPQVIFQGTNKEGVDELAQDGDTLYFGFRGAGESRWALRKISKQGGEPQTVAKTFTLGQIAIDDSHIYFFDQHNMYQDDLCRVSKTGGEVIRLDSGYASGILALSKTLIYFAAGDDIYSFAQ
jgi:hypothetical protein